MSLIPGINVPPGCTVIHTPAGIRVITPEGRVMGTNPNEAASINPLGSQQGWVWDSTSGNMVPLTSTSMPGGIGGGRMGGRGGWGGFGGGSNNLFQFPGMGGGNVGGQFGTVTIDGVTYPPSGGGYGGGHGGGHRGGHRGGHGGHGGRQPVYGRPPVQVTYPGGGWGGFGGNWDTIGPIPPHLTARPVDPFRDFNPPYGGRPGQPGRGYPGHNNPWPTNSRPPTTSHPPSSGTTALKKLRDAPERVRKEDLKPDAKDCSICYRAFFEKEDGQEEIPVKLRTCPHIFGENCINEWVQSSNACPTCRVEFPVMIRLRHGQWVPFDPPKDK